MKYIIMLKNELRTLVWSNDLQHNETVDQFLILSEYLIPQFARVASNRKNKIANTKHLSHFHLVSSECPKSILKTCEMRFSQFYAEITSLRLNRNLQDLQVSFQDAVLQGNKVDNVSLLIDPYLQSTKHVFLNIARFNASFYFCLDVKIKFEISFYLQNSLYIHSFAYNIFV